MLQKPAYLMLAILLLGTACNPVSAAEREDVRKVINLVTSVKMPYPENLTSISIVLTGCARRGAALRIRAHRSLFWKVEFPSEFGNYGS